MPSRRKRQKPDLATILANNFPISYYIYYIYGRRLAGAEPSANDDPRTTIVTSERVAVARLRFNAGCRYSGDDRNLSAFWQIGLGYRRCRHDSNQASRGQIAVGRRRLASKKSPAMKR